MQVENPLARERCIIWSLKLAEDSGRAASETWLPQNGAVSGTFGEFQLLVCGAPDLCQDRKPVHLTPSSCKTGAYCLGTGATSEFVQRLYPYAEFGGKAKAEV
ncbi:hypothetical protein AK812_SmicGene435 [Symbiodinium microadriaticum]|uniref:Uncharacterized protein n=1 Tax=Symbiodinium microadriaticum TaxID=2951 RepID=A0A1Q9F6N1_SYMMI|nr:hypothetical protein AK812_SmicGene435 [Symbiodinium microadriaticum]